MLSNSLKLIKINIYKTAFIVQILTLIVGTIMGFYSIFACRNNVNQIIYYIIII